MQLRRLTLVPKDLPEGVEEGETLLSTSKSIQPERRGSIVSSCVRRLAEGICDTSSDFKALSVPLGGFPPRLPFPVAFFALLSATGARTRARQRNWRALTAARTSP